MIKIAFFDIDGTLMVKNKRTISDITCDTLNRLKENGVLIVVATGRLPSMIPDLKGVEFDAYITFNGALTFIKDRAISKLAFSKEDTEQLIKNSTELKLPIILAAEDKRYKTGHDVDLWFYEDGCLETDDLKDDKKIYQAVVSCTKDNYQKILSDTKNLQITDWGGITADITRLDVDKGKGIREVLKYFCIDPEDAIAFGDADNDIPMLNNVAIGISMANGSDRLKAIADDICPDIENEGITHYLKKHKLI